MNEHAQTIFELVSNPRTGMEAHAALEIKTLRQALQRHIDLAMHSIRGVLYLPCVVECDTKDACIGESTQLVGIPRHGSVVVIRDAWGLTNKEDVEECAELVKAIGTGTHGN